MCSRTRGTSPGPQGRRPETPSWGGDSSRRLNDSIGRESTASSFDAFLQRQEDFVRKQDMNVQLMRSEVSGQAKPIISANSERILRRKEKEDAVVSRPFLERVEHTIELKSEQRPPSPTFFSLPGDNSLSTLRFPPPPTLCHHSCDPCDGCQTFQMPDNLMTMS